MRARDVVLIVASSLAATPLHAGQWMVPTTARDLKNPVPASAANAARGAKIFADNCVRCHGKVGAGDGAEARVEYDLRELIKPLTDGAVYWKITHGVGKMPSHAGALTDEERWLSVNHLRALARERAEAEASKAREREAQGR